MIKKILQNILWKFNYDISKTYSEESNISNLMYRMHPIQLKDKALILIGNQKRDGWGYLVPDLIRNIQYTFSPEVGPESTFENDLTLREVRCFMADFSVNGPSISDHDYQKYIVGCLERILEFFDPVHLHVNNSSNALPEYSSSFRGHIRK